MVGRLLSFWDGLLVSRRVFPEGMPPAVSAARQGSHFPSVSRSHCTKLRGVKEYSSTLSILTRQNKLFWGPFLTLKRHTGSFTLPEGPMILRVGLKQSFFQDYFLRVFSLRDCPWTIIWNLFEMIRWRPHLQHSEREILPKPKPLVKKSHVRRREILQTWQDTLKAHPFLGKQLVTCGGYVAWRSGDCLIHVRTICFKLVK